MAITLYHIGRTPEQRQFQLVTFTEQFKANEAADVVIIDASVPQEGDAHPDYPFMFVTGRHVSETGERSSEIDVTYMGCMKDDGGGNPVLPSSQNTSDTQVQSASSSRASTGQLLTSAISIQFYAPSTVLSYISYLGAGSETPPSPAETPTIITWVVGDTSFSITNIYEVVGIFFSLQTVVTSSATEIVAGKFWLNSVRATVIYVPFIFDVPSGAFISLASPGSGYSVGNSLTITSGGESATLSVLALGIGGSIANFSVTTSDFTVAHNFVPASGGSGSGAQFNVIIIP